MDILLKYLKKFQALEEKKQWEYANYQFLKDNLPIFTCSDKTIEEIYYFRAYTFAKHICKNTKGQFIITEFSIPVHWAKDREGAIACPVGHQLREIRWFKKAREITRQYIEFWLDDIDGLLYYNNWFLSAVYDYLLVSADWAFIKENLEKMIEYVTRQKKEHLADCGMYKSVDNYDGMELSISAYGIRPTINSYVYANSFALSNILEYFGDDRAKEYKNFSQQFKKDINENLFKNDFYYALPLNEGESCKEYMPQFSNPNPTWDVKEQMGYIPFYFNIPEKEHCVAFQYLTDKNVFSSPYGITTADKSHPQFNYYFGHSCLWNGPVWPFATSQTLTGIANYLQQYDDICITANDYADMLHTYAMSQYLTEKGVTRPFIDENLDGETGEWLARKWITEMENETYPNGRGFDYNHSTFIDLVITGICGIIAKKELDFKPLVGDKIEWFTLSKVEIQGKQYTLTYDKNKGLIYSLSLND